MKINLCSYLILEKIYNLPPYLTHLSINCYYSYSLNDLPQGLLYLNLQDYEGEINDLPNTLKELCVYNYYRHYKINMLPESIEILDIPRYMARIEKLPANLKKLRVYYQSQHLLDYEKFQDMGIEVIYQKP